VKGYTPSVFARFSICWLHFVLKSEIPLEGAPIWLDLGHPDSRDMYIKHHCKGRLLQRHPEAIWPCKSVCTVTRDLCRKLSNKSVISFAQILFITPVIKLSRRTVYVTAFTDLIWLRIELAGIISRSWYWENEFLEKREFVDKLVDLLVNFWRGTLLIKVGIWDN